MTDSPPIKDNAHIAADRKAFMDAYGRAREQLAKLHGVSGVGFGLKITGSKITDDVAIVVHVRAKKSPDKVAADQRIPSNFEGYRTDVRASAPVRLASTSCDNDQSYPKIQGGIQIEAFASTAPLNQGPITGTLGCLVRGRNNSNDDNWYAMTCQHVLFDDTNLKTKDGDGVYHPYRPRTDKLGVERKGTLLGTLRSDDSEHGTYNNFYVDAAVVRLDIGSSCFGSTCGNARLTTAMTIANLNVTGQTWITPQTTNQITDVRAVDTDSSILNQQVFKVGRTTSRTVGRVIGINSSADDVVTITTDDGTEVVPVESRPNCIEIMLDGLTLNCKGKDSFGWDGDSGAFVVDDHNKVIGIFFGRGQTPDPQTTRYHSYACHIVPALDRLDVCVPAVGGTSHGTTNATDGSGLTVPSAASDLSDTSGGPHLAALGPRSRSPRGAPSNDLPALSSPQQQRLTRLRDALRLTEPGRAFDAAFSDMQREISSLVRHSRPVTVTWHRNRGPAFLARTLNHLRGDADSIPLAIDGVSRSQLLEQMRAILEAHGSNPLRASLSSCESVLPLLAHASTADEFLDALHNSSSVEAIEV